MTSHLAEGDMEKIQGSFPFVVVYDATVRIFNDIRNDIFLSRKCIYRREWLIHDRNHDSHTWRRPRRPVSTRIIAVLTSWVSYRTVSVSDAWRSWLQYYWFAWRISIPVSFFSSDHKLCREREPSHVMPEESCLQYVYLTRNELRVLRN